MSWAPDMVVIRVSLLLWAEFSRPVSSMCENHDSLSHRSISEQRRLRSPSVDEQETELEPSLEQDEEEKEQEQDQETDQDGNVTPSRKKEIVVGTDSWCPSWVCFNVWNEQGLQDWGGEEVQCKLLRPFQVYLAGA